MKKILITSCLALIAAVSILSSCSEDDNGPNQGPQEIPLKADAGVNQTVAPFTIVTLDGTASTGPEGVINYQWLINNNPGNINLTSVPETNNAKVTFEPKVNGSYSFTLRITRDANFSEASVTVTVTGALTLSGTLAQSTTLVDIDPDPSMPDYIISGDLIIPDGVTLGFAIDQNSAITVKSESNAGIIIETGGKLVANLGSNHRLTADTGWKGILVDGGAIEFSRYTTIENAGASAFAGQAEPAAITFTGVLPSIYSMNNLHFNSSPSYDILVESPVSGANGIITGNSFSNAKPIKAPIDFVNKIGSSNNLGAYDYIQLVPSGAGTIDALAGGVSYNFGHGIIYFIDGDFTSGSDVVMTNATILMKSGAGILAQKRLETNTVTLKGLNGANWKGIAFADPSSQMIINNTIIENAGSDIFNTGFFTSAAKAAIYFSSGNTTTLSNNTITNSGGYGIYNDSPSSAVAIQNTTISGTTLSALRTRVDFVHATVVGTGNTFTMPAGVAAVEVHVPNSTVSPIATWRALGGSNYYLLSGNAYLSSGSWSLAPGVNLRFRAGKSLNLQQGNFTAIGTALAPITFDSEAGTAGTWAGIHVQTTTKFEFCEIKNGGEVAILKNGVTPATEKANVIFDYGGGVTTNTFKNNTVSGSGGYGILVEATRQNPDALNVANNNTFSTNTSGDAIVK